MLRYSSTSNVSTLLASWVVIVQTSSFVCRFIGTIMNEPLSGYGYAYGVHLSLHLGCSCGTSYLSPLYPLVEQFVLVLLLIFTSAFVGAWLSIMMCLRVPQIFPSCVLYSSYQQVRRLLRRMSDWFPSYMLLNSILTSATWLTITAVRWTGNMRPLLRGSCALVQVIKGFVFLFVRKQRV